MVFIRPETRSPLAGFGGEEGREGLLKGVVAPVAVMFGASGSEQDGRLAGRGVVDRAGKSVGLVNCSPDSKSFVRKSYVSERGRGNPEESARRRGERIGRALRAAMANDSAMRGSRAGRRGLPGERLRAASPRGRMPVQDFPSLRRSSVAAMLPAP